jgi:hypothetical protein
MVSVFFHLHSEYALLVLKIKFLTLLEWDAASSVSDYLHTCWHMQWWSIF